MSRRSDECRSSTTTYEETAFALRRGAFIYGQEPSIKFIVAGHTYPGQVYPKLLETFVNQVNKLEPDALFILGDITWTGSDKDWNLIGPILSKLKAPYHLIPGNHDLRMNKDSPQLWLEKVGYFHTSIVIGDYKFILLNTTPESGKYRFDEEEIEFLKKELTDYQNYQQVFLMFHHELWLYDYIKWDETIYPIIKGKVNNVFAGNATSYFYSQFSYDQKIKYFLTGFPGYPYRIQGKDLSLKPTFLLVNAQEDKLKVDPILVELSADDPYNEIKPYEKKPLKKYIANSLSKLWEKVNRFGKKLLALFLGTAFLLGFLVSTILLPIKHFLMKIVKKIKKP